MIQLDTRLGWLNPHVISFNALSVGTCKLEFTLTENNQLLDISSLRVMIEVKSPSGAVIEDDVTVVDALTGKIEKELTSNMIVEEGMHYLELSIYSQNNTKLLVTNKVRYLIGANFGEEAVKSTSQYSTLQGLILDVDELKYSGIVDTATVKQYMDTTEKAKNDTIAIKSEIEQLGVNTNQTIINQGTIQTNRVNTEGTTQANRVTTEGTTQANRVITEGTKQINLAKDEVVKATQQANIATQKATEISASATQINKNKREIVDTLPANRLNGQLFFIRKG